MNNKPSKEEQLPFSVSLFDEKGRRRRILHLIITGIVFMLTLLISLFTFIGTSESEDRMMTAFVSTRNLKSPYQLTESDIIEVEYPERLFPQALPLTKEDILKNILIRPMVRGELFLPHHFHNAKVDFNFLTDKVEHEKFGFPFAENWAESPLPSVQVGEEILILGAFSRDDFKLTDIITNPLKIVAIEENKNAGGKILILNTSKDDARVILFARGARVPLQVILPSSR